MRRGSVIFLICIFSLALLYGCDNLNISIPGLKKDTAPTEKQSVSIPVSGTLIAKVNNIPLTLEDLNQEIEAFNTLVPEDRPEAKLDTREEKIDYLKNEMVRRALLYQEALDRGLERNKDVQRALEKTKQDLLVMQLVREEADKITVTSAEVEEYYNTFKDQLKEPEERQIREVVVLTEVEARDILIELLRGVDFATLARERSKSASAGKGGDLGFISAGQKFSQFDNVAFSESLEVGKVSSIFKGPDGYYILKLEGKRGGKLKSLSEMWEDIKRGLTFLKQQQHIEEMIGKLSQEAKIEIYEGEIK
jgi:peptidyl-prolyl cis-trans isomerase C